MDCTAHSDAAVATSDFARPASGAVTCATGGTDCATPSDTTMATFDYSWLGAVAVACSTTTEGMGTTTGAAGPANEAATTASLLPKTGVTSGSTSRLV